MLALFATALLAPWTPLFDGKTLTGWKQLNGTASYAIEGKEIVGRTKVGSPNSFLCTEKTYSDFELEFEVKTDPALNSGVQIRSHSVPGYQNGRVHGYQVEVDPTERAFSGGIYDEARRGWLQDLSKNERARKAFKTGQWNKYRVVAMGDHLQTWVNGVPAADLHDPLATSGFIGLQVHNSDKAGLEVRWRNVRIKDLAQPLAKGARWLLHSEGDLKNWVSERKTGATCPWEWRDGCLVAKPNTGNILTKESFTDFEFHIEFAVTDNGLIGQANGNSGVYIMQSYEIQILNSAGRGPLLDECGSLYNIKAPDYAMALPALAWQSYDIKFTAPKWNGTAKTADARLTMYHNGVLVHNDVAVPRPTGAGAPESPTPRPIRLQDHGQDIRFRNVWVKN